MRVHREIIVRHLPEESEQVLDLYIAELGHGYVPVHYLVHTGQGFDLVIADIKMPVMDGIELLKRIREDGNDVSFVILSGFAEFSYAQEALKHRCSAYILKPVEKDSLIAVVEKVIASKEDQEIETKRNKRFEKAQ